MTSSISIVTIASALVLGVADPSQAAVVVQGFSVAPDRWFDDGNPFGVGTNPSLSGSVTVNTADTTGTSFLAINYVTGSKIWSLADIDVGASRVNFDGMGNVSEFALVFSGGSNYVYSFNTVSIGEPGGGGFIACNDCVSLVPIVGTGAPEPANWAMMIFGFGIAGAAMRRVRYTARGAYSL